MHAPLELVVTPPAPADPGDLDRSAIVRASFARGPVAIARGDRAGFWFRRFGIARAGDWPAAALRAAAPAGHVLCADPVHLAVSGDTVVLDATAAATVGADEADALIARLNAHFATDGWRFAAVTPGQWLLETPAPIDATTTPLADAHARPLDATLPAGAAARALRRALNEAQMLLFDCPVNAARAARGVAPINGVWLWGGGTCAARTAPAAAAVRMVWSDQRHVQQLACRAGGAAAPLPPDAAALPVADGAAAIDLDLSLADPATWAQTALTHWIEPLARVPAPVQLTVVHPDAALGVRLRPHDFLARWRRGSLARRLAAAGLAGRDT
ncbi:MAG: hypothetical protein JNM90_24810 [Burkholderiales bacterium]|nr:hypothetical protein [Burkholderiales bacterium]